MPESFTVATPADDDEGTVKIDNRSNTRQQPINQPSIQSMNHPPQNTKKIKVNGVLIGSRQNNTKISPRSTSRN